MATLVSPLITVSDGGGIPDRLEEHWHMNIHDARDEADDYDGDGHSNYAKMPGR